MITDNAMQFSPKPINVRVTETFDPLTRARAAFGKTIWA
jgi:hypothetical protein